MAMERRMPGRENTFEDMIAKMLANRTEKIVEQEEDQARVGIEAGQNPGEEEDKNDSDVKED